VNQQNRLSSESENALVHVWSARELGATSFARLASERPAIQELIAAGWLVREGDSVGFSSRGKAEAEELVRRHRLAEVLLREVLEVRPERANLDACLWEHVLSPEVTDTICMFLGHPRHCPHGKPIPPGRCCSLVSRTIGPLVQPLTSLRVGASARITFIAPRVRRRLDRLAALGIVPGTVLTLRQKSPSYVVRADQTEVAIEEDVARDIFVRDLGNGQATIEGANETARGSPPWAMRFRRRWGRR